MVANKSNYLKDYENFFADKLWSFTKDFLDLTENVTSKNRYLFFGNGASASIASHLANDFTKALNVNGMTFHDPAFLTCFSNDYGYEHWISETIKAFSAAGDVIVLISSSGRSENILNAAKTCKALDLQLISLTGPTPSPLLLDISDLNLSVDSNLYNIIECCHMAALCAVVDSINPIAIKS